MQVSQIAVRVVRGRVAKAVVLRAAAEVVVIMAAADAVVVEIVTAAAVAAAGAANQQVQNGAERPRQFFCLPANPHSSVTTTSVSLAPAIDAAERASPPVGLACSPASTTSPTSPSV